MSLINETLQNLNSRNDEVLINPSTKSRSVSSKGASTNSSQNLLILIISLGIVIALFYIVYNYQINQYFFNTKNYVTQKTGNLASDVYAFRDKLHFKSTTEKNNKSDLSTNYSASIQARYYNAMNLLNEGNTEEARKNLRIILKEDPSFTPAKQAISMLKSDFK